mmetsp:Transcript_4141/g.7252  ORF Transcript_4141/g.7252 Transcript_4141/m.7252 type:complete len:90 (-) Transcript_4141:116-385(-)
MKRSAKQKKQKRVIGDPDLAHNRNQEAQHVAEKTSRPSQWILMLTTKILYLNNTCQKAVLATKKIASIILASEAELRDVLESLATPKHS